MKNEINGWFSARMKKNRGKVGSSDAPSLIPQTIPEGASVVHQRSRKNTDFISFFAWRTNNKVPEEKAGVVSVVVGVKLCNVICCIVFVNLRTVIRVNRNQPKTRIYVPYKAM